MFIYKKANVVLRYIKNVLYLFFTVYKSTIGKRKITFLLKNLTKYNNKINLSKSLEINTYFYKNKNYKYLKLKTIKIYFILKAEKKLNQF